MRMSNQGLDLLIQREGIRNEAYRDTKGKWTIGIGHTGEDVQEGLVWSDELVKEVFAQDIGIYEDSVNACVKVPLQQNQFDALVSFAFNCGVNALAYGSSGGPSSILRALNASDYDGAANAFNNWMADADVRTRRAGEREQFAGRTFAARCPV